VRCQRNRAHAANSPRDALNSARDGGTPLPPSQVVRTTPRGGRPGAAPQITTANVPPISATPPVADQITFIGNTVTVPD
jgi:hydroxybutyrate-dimer hydrolase